MSSLSTNAFTRRQLLQAGAVAGLFAAVGLGTVACAPGSGTTGAASSPNLRLGLRSYSSAAGTNANTGANIEGFQTLLDSLSGVSAKATDIVAADQQAAEAKIRSMLLSNSIDVVQTAGCSVLFRAGLIRDLSEYYDRDAWTSNFLPSVFAPPQGRLTYPAWSEAPTAYISAPGTLEVFSLAYDTQLFDDFGVEYLSAQPTMDEILEKAAQLTGKNPRTGQDCYGMFYNATSQSHFMLFYFGQGVDFGTVDQNSPELVTFDTPRIVDSIRGMIGATPYCPPGFDVGQGAENWGTDQNNIAMNMVVSAGTMNAIASRGLSDRYALTEGVRDTDDHTMYISTQEFAISAKAEDPDAAWELLKALSGDEGQRFIFENYGQLPSLANPTWFDSGSVPYADQFLTVANAAQNAVYPEYMFSAFRAWMAGIITKAAGDTSYDFSAELAEQQQKAEQYVADTGA